MTSRIPLGSALAALALAVGGLSLLPAAGTQAADDPDVTPPQVRLDPCGEETSCRRAVAQVYGDLAPGDDLAVLGARIGDEVLAETVFDDGSGFHPYGAFWGYCSDVAVHADYALKVTVPPGTSDITFYARDLEGNTSEHTTTMLGPVPPGPVPRLVADQFGPRAVRVTWGVPDLGGSCSGQYTVTTPGRSPKHASSVPPSFHSPFVTYRKVTRGWHRFTVRATSDGGTGPARTVRLYLRPGRMP